MLDQKISDRGKVMHDLETHARWAIMEWLIGQEKFARSVLNCNSGDFEQVRAAGILLFTRMMRVGLTRYEEPETRRTEILRDLLRDRKNSHSDQAQLPRKVLLQLGTEASRRAFRESYPGLARFSDEIVTLRREMETASERTGLRARRMA